MKSKCSFILKASTALVLALLMLFGSVTTSVAAVVNTAEAEEDSTGSFSAFAAVKEQLDLADTGAQADLAETGYNGWKIYGNAKTGSFDSSNELWSGSGSSGTAYIDCSNIIGSNFEFKLVCEGTWCGTTTTAMSLNTGRTFSWGSGNNAKYKVTKGILTITVSDLTVTITQDQSPSVYLYGDGISGGDWTNKTNSDYKMTQTSGSDVFTKTVTMKGGAKRYFRAYKDYGSGTEYGRSDADTALTNGSSSFVSTANSTSKAFYVDLTNYGTTSDDISVAITLDLSSGFKASWAKKTYTVSYNKGSNGTGTNTTDTKTFGTDLTLKGAIFTRTGYTQTAWNTNPSGTGGTSYALSGSYTANAAVTLYPTWTVAGPSSYTLRPDDGVAMDVASRYVPPIGVPAHYIAEINDDNYVVDSVTFTCTRSTGWTSDPDAHTITFTVSNNYPVTAHMHYHLASDPSVTGTIDSSEVIFYPGDTSKNFLGVDPSYITIDISDDPAVATVYSNVSNLTNGEITLTKSGSFINISKNSITSNTETFTITPNSVGSGTITVTYKNSRTNETLITRTIHVTVVSTKRNVTVGKMLATDGNGYTTAAASEVSATLSGGGSYSHSNPDTFNPTTTEVSGYKFVGWIKSATALTTAAMNTTPVKTTLAYGSVTMTEDVETYYYALYTKIYKLSAFDSYEMKNSQVTFVTAPPKSITIKHTGAGGTVTTYTYSYDGTKAKGNPDSPDGTKPTALPIATDKYGQGNYIQYYAGDEITLTYSAMASSEILKGVFYNNSANFYVNKPTPQQFVQHDYAAEHTLYRNNAYYTGATGTYPGVTVDNDKHSIKFTGTQDYKNIDVEIATKRKVYFSDYKNAVITSKNVDDYYFDGEALSVTGDQLSVAAAKSDIQTNTITASKIKFYKANADGTKGEEVDKTTLGITITGSTSSSTQTTPSSLVFNGNMPPYDLYIDLNIESSYTIKLGTKIVSDLGGTATRLASKATVKINSLSALTTADVTTNTTSVATGTTAALSVTNLTPGYMFVGWYWGDASGPDYNKGFISEKQSLGYTPKKGGIIWAVGTKNLFINGSKYITGKATDWYSENNQWKNQQMKFDPSRGTQGSYYWEITDTMFASAGNDFKYTSSNSGDTGGSNTEGKYFKGGDNYYYWCNNDDSKHGKAFFQFIDTATGYTNREVWKSVYSFLETADGTTHGKILKRDMNQAGNTDDQRLNGQGFIDFAESRYAGYSSPLRIYLDAATKDLDVVATPILSNLYVSNGYSVGSTLKTDAVTVQPVVDGVVKTSGQTGYFAVKTEGDGWNPDHEGHVSHYIPQKKGATVRITKNAGGSDKIVAFLIYDIDNKTVRAERNITKGTTASGKTPYYIDLTLANERQNLYIVPIVEEAGAKVTITFDATQLNRKQWGDIVTAYSWYQGSNNDGLGEYPGQPMIPSDDMSTWTTSFPTTKGGNELAGITFTNYVDGIHSWLGCSGVMGEVSDHKTGAATGGIINVYNHVESGDNGEYSRTNYKAQTYDYHEPIALYDRYKNEDSVNITFQMKDGNSTLISWYHKDLVNTSNNILNPSNEKWRLNFEYLTNAKGDQYIDMNGNPLGANNKPTATFYVASKGLAVYQNSTMKYIFDSGQNYEMQGYEATYSRGNGDRGSYTRAAGGWSSAITYGGVTGLDMKYAVQWYVYDAQGNYITTVLSAGIADLASGSTDTYIATQLENMGYAVDGKSVAICYDKPRYMYGDWDKVTNSADNINSGPDFDAYRFEGQWIAAAQTDTVKVNVEVAMMTDSGEVLANSNTAGYGNATAGLRSGITFGKPNYAIVAPDNSWAQTAATDAKLNGIVLNASSQNFIGWYYYDANTGDFTKATYSSNENFYPNYTNKDVTYYAVYRASAVYNYIYQGREGERIYSAAGNDLTPDEMATGTNQNKVVYANHEADILSKLPIGIGIFKKNIDFSAANANSWTKNNDTQYILKLSKFPVTLPTYTLTAHYINASGELVTIQDSEVYNGKAVNLTSGTYTDSKGASKPAGTSVTSYQTGFIGWYEYDSTNHTTGDLLSTQANYGMRLTKNQDIIAVYNGTLPSDGWSVFIDENEVNKELTTKDTGVFYNDTIVRVRNGSDVKATLPENSKIGVLVVNDNRTDKAINTISVNTLESLINKIGSGKTAKASGLSITRMEADTQTSFNRTDIAVKSDYAKTNGTKYCVYAYFYDGSSYHFSAASAIKSYE